MTPTEIKQIRRELGLSANGMAKALGMGVHGGRTVRRWEAGDIVPHPHTQAAIRRLHGRRDYDGGQVVEP